MIVSCEMVRMSMKMHAYLREKLVLGRPDIECATFIPEWAKRKGVTIKDLDVPTITIGTLGTELKRFLYFHFSPTLIYRDSYVQNRKIRWRFVAKTGGTFMILIFYLWCVFKSLCIPTFKHTMNSPGELR